MRKIVSLLLALPVLLSSCTNAFWQMHEDTAHLEETKTEVATTLKDFREESIPVREGELLAAPSTDTLDRLVGLLDGAHTRIWVEVYMLTERRIIASLEAARARGIDVRVLLEPHPYNAGNINDKAAESLTGAGIPTAFASSDNYALTHAKYIIVDDRYIISTANLSHTSFTSNREYLYIGADSTDLAALVRIFTSDMAGKRDVVSSGALVVSPDDSRAKIETVIRSAKQSLDIETETLSEASIESLLIKKAASGVRVRLLLGNVEKVPENGAVIDRLRAAGVAVTTPKKPFIHAKIIVVDSTIVFIGSENLTTASLDHNREVGILLRNPSIAETIARDFDLPSSLTPPKKKRTTAAHP